MIRAFCLILLSILLTGCAGSNRDAAPLRVMSYNIKHGLGNDGKLDLTRAAGVIKAQAPDLVALQEIDMNAGRSGSVDQAAELGRLTGMHHAFARFMEYDGGEYGLAVLSRSPIEESWRIELPPGKQEPRSALAVRTTPARSATPVVFVSVHLDWLRDDAERFAQAGELLTELTTQRDPVIIAGDFNDTPESRTMELVFGSYQNVDKAADDRMTMPSTDPRSEIDFIVYKPAWAFSGMCRVLDEPVVSDHCPVVADLIPH